MAQRKNFLVSAVQLVPIYGHRTVPTAVYYRGREPIVGNGVWDEADTSANTRDNFKIELGQRDPSSLARKASNIAPGSTRTPIGIAKDFCAQVLSNVQQEIESQGNSFPKRILIAEPISLGGSETASDSWLSNYRACMRRVLHGMFQEIDFMPEPFAVFQYYRYGFRHPLIAEKQKHIALVMDFGGGTFDVSVIETTADGDISQGGRNSRPLSASSIPVGGFFVNKMIAESLLFEALEKGASGRAVRIAIKRYEEIKNYDGLEVNEFSDDMLSFFRAYRVLLRRVEDAKISICSRISNWQLDADLDNAASVLVAVPKNPFSGSPRVVELRLDTVRIREIFESRVWKQRLLPAIRNGLNRARDELEGKAISVVLLSGGSSNIRWLKYLIERELQEELHGAAVLELAMEFQEIVAKGLAVECARRYYNDGDSDFRAVTYNRLCLLLYPNGKEVEASRFRASSRTAQQPAPENGVLLPSSSSLRKQIGKSIKWKTRLSAAPSRFLEYYFMRSSFNPQDLENRYNIIETRVETPPGTRFGSSIELELIVRDDGTAVPKFIYGKSGDRGREVIVEGQPFYMDMTFAAEESSGETYLGFDFGTSTSAFSFVSNDHVEEITRRSGERGWQEISELAQVLPYPIAYPLASYLAETNDDGMEKWGRETLESMLMVASYICYAESCTDPKGTASSLFKNLTHRSAGPLWHLLKQCAAKVDGKSIFSSFAVALTKDDFAEEINGAVDEAAQTKHGKRTRGLDYPRIIGRVGNQLARMFAENHMGCFEDVRSNEFSNEIYEGVFRSIQGKDAPFTNLFDYEGSQAIPSAHVYVVSPAKGLALDLYPLFISGLKRSSGERGAQIHVFDRWQQRENVFGYKAIQEEHEFAVDGTGKFSRVYDELCEMKTKDRYMPCLEGIKLIRRD